MIFDAALIRFEIKSIEKQNENESLSFETFFCCNFVCSIVIDGFIAYFIVDSFFLKKKTDLQSEQAKPIKMLNFVVVFAIFCLFTLECVSSQNVEFINRRYNRLSKDLMRGDELMHLRFALPHSKQTVDQIKNIADRVSGENQLCLTVVYGVWLGKLKFYFFAYNQNPHNCY
jgi:hypothetical protein